MSIGNANPFTNLFGPGAAGMPPSGAADPFGVGSAGMFGGTPTGYGATGVPGQDSVGRGGFGGAPGTYGAYGMPGHGERRSGLDAGEIGAIAVGATAGAGLLAGGAYLGAKKLKRFRPKTV